MRKIISLFFLLNSFVTKATVITWDGQAGDGLWSTAMNWNSDIVPGINDDVILDNSLITGNYTVLLPGGATMISVRSLTITPAGSNVILLWLPVSSTVSPGLTITGAGDALVLNRGAVLRNSSGSASGASIVIDNIFRINNGGRYIHNTSRANAAIVTALSTAPGTETGVFEYNVPSSGHTLSLSGRVYGTLELSATANGGAVNYTGSGGSMLRIAGDLKINAGVTFSISMTGDLMVQGNYSQAGSSAFNMQSSTGNNVVKIAGHLISQGTLTKSGTGLPVLELNGINNQDLNITGAITNNVTLSINNANGITLVSPLTLPYHLQLINGKIRTTAANILTMADNATYSGGSSASFIEGPMKKAGDDAFVFPVGKGAIYAPIGMQSPGMAITNVFMAEYVRANPQTAYGINYETVASPEQIDHISYVEYWKLQKTTGALLPLQVTLPVTAYSFSKNMSTTFIAGYNTADLQWKHGGITARINGAPSPPYATGSLTSAVMTADGIFTLYSSDNYVLNPLPVELISFDATLMSNDHVLLKWQLADSYLDSFPFEVQRAGGDHVFQTIAIINNDNNSRSYLYTDTRFGKGINYYRLKKKEANGADSYSRVVTVFNGGGEVLTLSAFPQVVNDAVALTISSLSKKAMTIFIADLQGRIVKRQRCYLSEGKNSIALPVNNLYKGQYVCWGISGDDKTNVIRFIKE